MATSELVTYARGYRSICTYEYRQIYNYKLGEDTAEKPSEKEVKTIINSVYTASAASVLKTLKAKDGFLWLSARKEENEKKILPIEAWPEHIDEAIKRVKKLECVEKYLRQRNIAVGRSGLRVKSAFIQERLQQRLDSEVSAGESDFPDGDEQPQVQVQEEGMLNASLSISNSDIGKAIQDQACRDCFQVKFDHLAGGAKEVRAIYRCALKGRHISPCTVRDMEYSAAKKLYAFDNVHEPDVWSPEDQSETQGSDLENVPIGMQHRVTQFPLSSVRSTYVRKCSCQYKLEAVLDTQTGRWTVRTEGMHTEHPLVDVNNVVCISDGVLNSDPGSKTLSAHPALHHVAKALQDITQNSSTTMAHLLELAAGDIDPERCNPTAYDHYCAIREKLPTGLASSLRWGYELSKSSPDRLSYQNVCYAETLPITAGYFRNVLRPNQVEEKRRHNPINYDLDNLVNLYTSMGWKAELPSPDVVDAPFEAVLFANKNMIEATKRHARYIKVLHVDDTHGLTVSSTKTYAFIGKSPRSGFGIVLAYMTVQHQERSINLSGLVCWAIKSILLWHHPLLDIDVFVSDKDAANLSAFSQIICDMIKQKCLTLSGDPGYCSLPLSVRKPIERLRKLAEGQPSHGNLIKRLTNMYTVKWPPVIENTMASLFRKRMRLCVFHVQQAWRSKLRVDTNRIAHSHGPRDDGAQRKISNYEKLEKLLLQITHAKEHDHAMGLWNRLQEDMTAEGLHEQVTYLENNWFNLKVDRRRDPAWQYLFVDSLYLSPTSLPWTNNHTETHFQKIKWTFKGQQKRDTPSLMIALAGDPQNPVSQFAVPSASAITHDTNGNLRQNPKETFSIETRAVKYYEKIIGDTVNCKYCRLLYKNHHTFILFLDAEGTRKCEVDLLHAKCTCPHTGSANCAHIQAVRSVLEGDSFSLYPRHHTRVPTTGEGRDAEDNNDYFYFDDTEENTTTAPGRRISFKRDRGPQTNKTWRGRPRKYQCTGPQPAAATTHNMAPDDPQTIAALDEDLESGNCTYKSLIEYHIKTLKSLSQQKGLAVTRSKRDLILGLLQQYLGGERAQVLFSSDFEKYMRWKAIDLRKKVQESGGDPTGSKKDLADRMVRIDIKKKLEDRMANSNSSATQSSPSSEPQRRHNSNSLDSTQLVGSDSQQIIVRDNIAIDSESGQPYDGLLFQGNERVHLNEDGSIFSNDSNLE